MELLKLIIIFFVFIYILLLLMVKILEYKAKRLKIRDDKILLNKELSNLNVKQLRAKEKEVMKKITKYSFVETIFFLALIVTFWYCYIAIQNNDNFILAIIVFILQIVTLIVMWIIKCVLKYERYKYLTFIDEKNDKHFEILSKE